MIVQSSELISSLSSRATLGLGAIIAIGVPSHEWGLPPEYVGVSGRHQGTHLTTWRAAEDDADELIQGDRGGTGLAGSRPMRITNTAKQKMARGEAAYGYSLGLGSPLAAEVLAHSGIDFLLLDTQHGSFGPDSTIAALLAMAAGTATPMARVARNDYTMIGRLLDEGVLGIVIPMVHTAEDARTAAAACRLPPGGTRSWGWGRASRYGADYPDVINDELFVAVQLESQQAIEHAEEILSAPGVDGCWVGPSDLALSLGIHPREMASDERHGRLLEQALEACRNTGKIPGLACSSPAEARSRAGQGFQYLTAASDTGMLVSGARAGLEIMGLPVP